MCLRLPDNIFYRSITVLSILLLMTLTGCASTDDLGRVRYEINKLKTSIKDIKKKSPTMGQTDAIDKNLRELEAAQKSTTKTVSDLYIKIQDLTTEFQVLSGRLEEDRYYSEKSSTELTERFAALETNLKQLEKSVNEFKQKIAKLQTVKPPVKKEDKKSPIKKPSEKDDVIKQETPGEDKPETKKETAKLSVKDVYMAAYEAYKNNKNRDAREKFNSVLEDFPPNEYSDNARFWIGESYYREGNYEDSILAYEELFRNNPTSDKVPGAMLRQGLAFYALKDKKTGKIILEKLIQKYPDTAQAKLARKKIKKPAVPRKKQ